MSEEKKDIGASNVAATSDARPSNASDLGRDKPAMSDNAGTRARNQDVLPGILGKQLKAAYGELLNAPVPDAITDLIKKLKDKEPSTGSQAAGAAGGEENGQ